MKPELHARRTSIQEPTAAIRDPPGAKSIPLLWARSQGCGGSVVAVGWSQAQAYLSIVL